MKYTTVEKFEVSKTSFLNEYFYSASIKLIKVTLKTFIMLQTNAVLLNFTFIKVS